MVHWLIDWLITDSWPEDPPVEVINAMKKYFGHSQFRPRQWEIVRDVMNKRDVLAIMATGQLSIRMNGMNEWMTGYGKSVCYQLPSLLRGDVTIVVSPLLSLIEDQLKGLRYVDRKMKRERNDFIPVWIRSVQLPLLEIHRCPKEKRLSMKSWEDQFTSFISLLNSFRMLTTS